MAKHNDYWTKTGPRVLQIVRATDSELWDRFDMVCKISEIPRSFAVRLGVRLLLGRITGSDESVIRFRKAYLDSSKKYAGGGIELRRMRGRGEFGKLRKLIRESVNRTPEERAKEDGWIPAEEILQK